MTLRSASISESCEISDGKSSSGSPSGEICPFLLDFGLLLLVINRNKIQGKEEAPNTETVTTTAVSTGVRPWLSSLSISVGEAGLLIPRVQ